MTATRTDVPASTTADQRRYLEGGLSPLPCTTCGVRVLVKKHSQEQTSIQWTSSTSACPEISARIAEGEHPALVDTCPRLRATIEHAISEGILEVPDNGR